MLITMTLNGKKVADDVAADTLLIDFVRGHGCLSVKRGCETANCGLCTVLVDGRPVLSCSTLTARIDGKVVETMEGLQADIRSRPWRACRAKPPNSARSSRIRVRSSAASAIPAL